MKILVLGATGETGRLIVGNAVAKGYEVVALVRSKAKAADLTGAKLIEGDARDPAALTRAIAPRRLGQGADTIAAASRIAAGDCLRFGRPAGNVPSQPRGTGFANY